MQQDTAASEDDAPSVMPTIVLAAFGGGPLTTLLLWKYDTALALVSAPLGASVAGSLAACTIYIVRRAGRASGCP